MSAHHRHGSFPLMRLHPEETIDFLKYRRNLQKKITARMVSDCKYVQKIFLSPLNFVKAIPRLYGDR